MGIRKALTVGGLTFATMAVLQGSALAHFCVPADKPDGAGAVNLETDIRITKSGNIVAPGAFYDGAAFDLESDGFIRGGLKGDEGSKQFGMATLQAICNGPHDHGIIDPYGFTAEFCPLIEKN